MQNWQVPESIVELNHALVELQERAEKLQETIAEGAQKLGELDNELDTLDADEDKKLVQLGNAEIEGQNLKPFREALDSLRGRRKVLSNRREVLEGEQTGRRNLLAETQHNLQERLKQRQGLIDQWLRSFWEVNKDTLYNQARDANAQLFRYMIGAGQMGVRTTDGRWLMLQLCHPGTELSALQDGMAFRGEMVERAEAAR